MLREGGLAPEEKKIMNVSSQSEYIHFPLPGIGWGDHLILFWPLKCKGKSVGELLGSMSSLLKMSEALAPFYLLLDIIVRGPII